MEKSSQLRAPTALSPREEPQYPFDRRLGGAQSRSRRDGEETKIPAPAGKRTPVVQLVV